MDRSRVRRSQSEVAMRVGGGLALGTLLLGAGGEGGEPGADVLARRAGFYNQERPHQVLGYQTSAAIYFGKRKTA